MRALLATAAVILSVTAAQAQEMKPAASVAQETTERALPPAAAPTPSSTIVEKLRAAGELKDPQTLEAPAPKIDCGSRRSQSRPLRSRQSLPKRSR